MEEDVANSMDQLVGLLEKEGAIKLGDAAKALDVDKERIESWAKMLVKADVAQIHYSVIGGAILRKGPQFDSVVKKITPTSKTVSKPLPIKQKEAPPLAIKSAIKKVNQSEIPGDYKLIQKKIEEGEKNIERDLIELREEQIKIVDSMNVLMEEGNKLAGYIEALRQMSAQNKEKRKLLVKQ